MTIYFAEVFKKLRKEKNMTQEQAAEIFCISPQAVSRWECGSTYPDIELLPTIADYFKVSIEELLGAQKSRKQARINEYLNKFQNAINHGLVDDCINISRAAIKEFPNNYVLLNKLMYALFVSGDNTGNIKNWKENIEKYKNEIIEIGNKILNNCTDDDIRLEAKARLGFHYCEIGQLEKGKAVFESLPSEDSTKEAMLYWALCDEERLQYLRERTSKYCEILIWNIYRQIRHSDISAEEKIKRLETSETIVNSIYNYDDYGDWYGTFAKFYADIKVPLYLEIGNNEKAFEHLKKTIEYLKADKNLPDIYVHTSPLIAGTKDKKSRDTADTRPLAQILKEDILSRSCYDAIRNDKRFEQILQELEKK